MLQKNSISCFKIGEIAGLQVNSVCSGAIPASFLKFSVPLRVTEIGLRHYRVQEIKGKK